VGSHRPAFNGDAGFHGLGAASLSESVELRFAIRVSHGEPFALAVAAWALGVVSRVRRGTLAGAGRRRSL
jgi:hypothetical protein